VATWTDSCPLVGRCVECGNDLEWAGVFNPRRGDVQGFVEHAPDARRVLWWTYRTWAWTLLPWVFWSRIQIDQRTRPSLWAAWVFLLLVPAHLCAALLGIAVWHLRLGMSAAPVRFAPQALDYVSYFTFPVWTLRGGRAAWLAGTWPGYILPAAVFFLAWPALLMMLPITRDRARLRWEHVLRGLVFGMAWVLPLVLFRAGRNFTSVVALLNAPSLPGASSYPFGVTTRLAQCDPGLWGSVLFIWIAAWWLAACVRGWRIADGYVVWIMLTVAAALGAAIAHYWGDLVLVYFG